MGRVTYINFINLINGVLTQGHYMHGGVNYSILTVFEKVISNAALQRYRLYLKAPIVYKPVRPNVSDYDQNYHEKEESGYTARVNSNAYSGVVCERVYKGLIQDYERTMGDTDKSRFYLSFDSHYYL